MFHGELARARTGMCTGAATYPSASVGDIMVTLGSDSDSPHQHLASSTPCYSGMSLSGAAGYIHSW